MNKKDNEYLTGEQKKFESIEDYRDYVTKKQEKFRFESNTWPIWTQIALLFTGLILFVAFLIRLLF